MNYLERLLRNNLLLNLSTLDINQETKGSVVSLTQQAVSVICKKAKAGLPLCEKRKGIIPRLNAVQTAALPIFLLKSAIAYGFTGDYWTCKRVKYVIEKELNVIYEEKQVGRILKKIVWTRQKPQIKDAKQCQEKVEKWQAEDLPNLKKSLRRGLHYILSRRSNASVMLKCRCHL